MFLLEERCHWKKKSYGGARCRASPNLTCPWHGRKRCTAESISLLPAGSASAKGCSVHAPGYRDSRKGKSGVHDSLSLQSGPARAVPGCLCSMEAAGRQSRLLAAPGADPLKHKARHLGGTKPSASGRVCPRWILLAEAGGAAQCHRQEQPCPTFSAPSLQHVPPSNTGRAELAAGGGQWGYSRQKSQLWDFKLSLSREKERAQRTPISRAGQGFGKQGFPVKTLTLDTPQDRPQVAVYLVPVYREQKGIQGI